MEGDAVRKLAAPSLEDEQRLVAALRAGDEQAFVRFVHMHHGALIRVARSYVRRPELAEEVAQEAWQGLIESLPRFEPRTATLKTWLFRILVNCARARARKERRNTPSAALSGDDGDGEGPVVAAERFAPDDHPWAGHWVSPPRKFVLEDPAVSHETRELLNEAIARLPETQREVLLLRDVEGWTAQDVCDALGTTDMNQRVLLHRARSKVRAYLEDRLGEGS